MKCPRTGTDLKEVEIDGVKIDISESCGGVWFDNFELEKFDNVDKAAGAELVELLAKYTDKELDLEPRLQSPRHPEVTMMRQFYSPAQRIEIDVCPQSGGVWLDPGELAICAFSIQVKTTAAKPPNNSSTKSCPSSVTPPLNKPALGL